MTIVTPEPTIARDRWGRPLVIPPGGGKPIPYTRATTFIDVIDDKFQLQRWMQRMVALGLASRPDLLLSVSAHRDDKKQLDKICDDAREAANATAAATTGTALHALTELIDRGQDVPVLPANAKASLDAYAAATADLKATHIETFCVMDQLKVGGTPDRVVDVGGERYIADIKTGSIEWGALKISMQLALYARSSTYDVATGGRGLHGASTNRGIIIHLPSVTDPADAVCTLHWVDIETGWEAVKVAKQVRDVRQHKFTDLTEPFGTPDRPSLRLQKAAEAKGDVLADARRWQLEQRINACPTAADVRDLWAANQDVWDDALTSLAAAHVAKLDGNPAA